MRTEPRIHAAHEAVVVINFGEPEVTSRHEAIRKDIADRLRKSCAHLSEAAFEELVEKLVKAQLKGERRFGFHHPTAYHVRGMFAYAANTWMTNCSDRKLF